MSWVRIWVHTVFTTKKRFPFLTNSIRNDVIEHIKENAKEKDIFIKEIDGYTEHLHCLISLSNTRSISETLQLIKGESSYWINKNKLTSDRFGWQDDFWAVSVSESHIDKVKKYIQNQNNHHRYIPFEEEIDIFMKKYGWSFIKNE